MSEASDVVARSAQLGDSSQWKKTSEELAAEFSPNTKGWARRAIEKAAVGAWHLLLRRPSISPYRASESPVGNAVDFAQWTDGHVHQLLVEQGALFGDADSIAAVKALAAKGDKRALALAKHIEAQ